MRDDFLRGAHAVLDALSDPAVAEAWDRPSVLAEQTVGSLAGHLARGGVWVVVDYLDLDPPAAPTFADVAAYFAQVSRMGDADHRAIRDRGASVAAAGPAAVRDRLAERLAHLEARLPGEPPDRLLPVVGGAMALDGYLGTRLVEQVVHLDDLARSLGAAPTTPADLVARVAHLGLEIALIRRPPEAVLRHLFRDVPPGGAPPVVPVLA